MAANGLLDDILALEVLDTHTHLNIPGVPIPARDFWDIGHYFWFMRELQAAGYPADPSELDETKRVARFVTAFRATRNTSMNWVVRRIFRDLYDIEIRDAASVRTADAAVKDSFARREWAREVIDRLGIRHIAVNDEEHACFPELPGVGRAIPTRLGFDRDALRTRILGAEDQRAAAAEARATIDRAVAALAGRGIRGVRVAPDPFERLGAAAYALPAELPASGASADHVDVFLGHAVFDALAAHGIFAQLFLGIGKSTSGTTVPLNDGERIVRLHGLFARHSCDIELVLGGEINNLDAVQAARVFRNLHVGGMWWYNFRISTYRQSLQYRLEALPPGKCAIVASDARCIEWCYGKVLLIKHILADFLAEQVRRGWLDRADAVGVAREWLHDAPARRYL